ncbi:MAG: cadherin-like beta sandwich domain-containing protein [Clostridia bacterium]|nr:cadherin-like beta sandwich domain-containing protein [Clostridia bacterium]
MRIYKKIGILLLILTLILTIFYSRPTMAVSTTLSASSTSATSGENFSITVSSSVKLSGWTVSVSNNGGCEVVSASGGEVTGSKVYGTNLNGATTLATYTFKAPIVDKDTKYTINFIGTAMGDATDKVNAVNDASCSTIVTVKAKITTPSNKGNNGENTTTGTKTGNNTASNNTATEYKPTFTSVNETVYATNEVNVRESYSTTSKKLGALKKGDSITRTGKSTDGKWSKVTYQGKTAYISSAYLTTTKPEVKKSGNKNLASLTIKGVELGPAFNKETTQYTATVSNEITKLEIDAIPEDSKAKVEITDNNELKTGDNIIKIKVTAEDDTVRTYMLTVTKNENKETIENNKSTNSDELQLTNLKIKGVDFEQGFNPSIYTYELTLNNAKVKRLEITATPNQENAQVEIIGNENFKAGENIITILLTSADGTKTTNYQIKANLPEGTAETKRENETTQTMFYVIIGIVVATIIIAIALLISRHRKNMDMDTEDDDNEMIIEENRADEILGISDTEETKKRSKGKHSK